MDTEEYDYSQSVHFLEEFKNPFPDKPFIEELKENYRKLWQFKNCVDSWTLGVCRFKKYVYLLHRESETGPFLPLNIEEKVTVLENFHQQHVVITVQAVDSSGEDTDHLHSIVVKLGGSGADFSIEGLLEKLHGTSLEVLRPDLEAKYVPWTYTLAESTYRKISSIYRTLNQYAAQAESAIAPRPVKPQAGGRAEGRTPSQSRTQGSRSHAQSTAGARAEARKQKNDSNSAAEPTQKRRKESAGAGSSGSALTHVDRRSGKKEDPIPDFEKFAKAHNEFWKDCEGCYLFGQQTHPVDIAQCVLAKDEYIICKLQTEIVQSVKAELVQMGDAKMRQKVCLTPINKDGRLLREKPKSWNNIKSGKFMIINGQHSITASKELQISGCADKRRIELAK